MSIVAPPLARHRQLLLDRAAARGLLQNGHDAGTDAVVLDPSGRVEQAWGDGERLYLAANPGTELTELPAPDLPTGYRLLTVRAPGNRPTARELLILDLGSRGLTAAAIARRLATSPRTVHKHLENLYRKLGVSDRASAVRVAVAAGYLPSETSS
jgi:DNA-binding CsgD family transcriptional regulator